MLNPPYAPPARLWLGATYHPQDWPEERWAEDIRLMGEAGLNAVGLAERAWPTLEPVKRSHRFDWLDRNIALLGEAGITAVLTIPTSTPPAWLVQQYFDSMAEESFPRPGQQEGCRPWCPNSTEYQEATRRLVESMGEHYGSNPNVIGWEIDANQGPTCYCADCQELFRAYLLEDYGSLEELNRQSVLGCRGHTYSDWRQISLPICRHNAGLELDFRRFLTHTELRFQSLQVALLRPYLNSGVWITRSFAAWKREYDPYALAEGLDLASSEFQIGGGYHDYRNAGVLHDMARGLKRKNFWVVNTPGACTDQARARIAPFKDETQALIWQAVAHGADGVLCWQWRSSSSAAEPSHPDTLLDQSGQTRPLFDEIKLLGLEFSALSTVLAGSTTAKARVAILYSQDTLWATERHREPASFDYEEHLEHWYRPLAARNVAVDLIPADANLDQYKMVIAPALSVLDDKIVASLQDLVRHSGHLVLTIKTGIMDERFALLPSRQPGPLSKLAGVEVEDCYLLDEPVPVKGNWFEGVSRHWAERLRILDPNKAVKIARYGACNGWLDNEIAITVCAQGTGLTYMVGAYLDVAAQQAMVDHFLQNAGLQKIDTTPGVEVCIRVRPSGEQLYLVINHERSPATVTLPSSAENPLTGQPVTGPFRLAPYGVAVLVKSQAQQLPITG